MGLGEGELIAAEMEVGHGRNAEDLHSFKKLSLKRFPKVDERESSELRFWRKYQV